MTRTASDARDGGLREPLGHVGKRRVAAHHLGEQRPGPWDIAGALVEVGQGGIDRREVGFPPDVLIALVTRCWERVRLLADEDQVAPCIRTWWAGVHHRASVVVEIDTAAGVVAASDAFFYFENVEQDIPLGIGESIEEALRAYARVRKVAARIVPLYDPRVIKHYPGGVIA